jgi:hypothetical protein
MTGFQAASAIFLLTFGSVGSTCHGQQSAGSGEPAAKDPERLRREPPRRGHEHAHAAREAGVEQLRLGAHGAVLRHAGLRRSVRPGEAKLLQVRAGGEVRPARRARRHVAGADRKELPQPIRRRPREERAPRRLAGEGAEGAPVTLVEFADFECPFCAMEAPVLEKMWQGHQSNVRFVYKYFVIAAHPHGESAARAAIAARKPGEVLGDARQALREP